MIRTCFPVPFPWNTPFHSFTLGWHFAYDCKGCFLGTNIWILFSSLSDSGIQSPLEGTCCGLLGVFPFAFISAGLPSFLNVFIFLQRFLHTYSEYWVSVHKFLQLVYIMDSSLSLCSDREFAACRNLDWQLLFSDVGTHPSMLLWISGFLLNNLLQS